MGKGSVESQARSLDFRGGIAGGRMAIRGDMVGPVGLEPTTNGL